MEILRRATASAYFARDTLPMMMFPLVLDLADDGIAVTVPSRVLGVLQAGLLRLEESGR